MMRFIFHNALVTTHLGYLKNSSSARAQHKTIRAAVNCTITFSHVNLINIVN